MHTESHKQPKLRQHDSEAPSRGKITERSRSVPLSTIRVRSIATNNGPCNIKTYIFESNESQSPISGNNESAYKKCSDNGCRHQSTHCQQQEIAFVLCSALLSIITFGRRPRIIQELVVFWQGRQQYLPDNHHNHHSDGLLDEMDARPYQSTLKVEFASNKQASIVQQCLEGDDELQPTKIEKTFLVADASLIMYVLFT